MTSKVGDLCLAKQNDGYYHLITEDLDTTLIVMTTDYLVYRPGLTEITINKSDVTHSPEFWSIIR